MEGRVQNILNEIYSDKVKLELDRISDSIIYLTGGINGLGDWIDYLQNIKEFLDRLYPEVNDFWVIKLESNPLDDIFYLQIGYLAIR